MKVQLTIIRLFGAIPLHEPTMTMYYGIIWHYYATEG